VGGAATTGLLDGIDAQATDFESLFAAASPETIAALYRLDAGPTGYDDDFIGFDMLLLLNMQGDALLNPLLGYDPAGLDGLFASVLFSDESSLSTLDGYEIYATLIPEDAGLFNLSAMGAIPISGGTLDNGEFLFLNSTAVVPLPGAVVLGSMGLGLAGWLCRRRREGDTKA